MFNSASAEYSQTFPWLKSLMVNSPDEIIYISPKTETILSNHAKKHKKKPRRRTQKDFE